MSAPWDGEGALVVGHPQKWMIQKSKTSSQFNARWIDNNGKIGQIFSAPLIEVLPGWTELNPQVKLRLVRLEAQPVPQLEPVSGDFSSFQIEKAESEWIKKKSRIGLGVLAFLALVLAFWPKPKVTDIPADVIPPQMAKLILQKRTKTAPSSGSRGAMTAQSKAPLSQAMKSESFRKSISQLLSSQGFKRLTGGPPGKLPSLQTGGNLSGSSAGGGLSSGPALPGVKLVGLGGGSGGGGVGYEKGGHAAVQGQGSGQVLLDLESSYVDEGLTRDEVGRVIHSHLAEVRYCYEASMVHSPEIEGRISISFSVGSDGGVTSSSVHDSTVRDPRLDACLLKRLNQWKFPKPKGGVTVAVTYPFIFKNLGR